MPRILLVEDNELNIDMLSRRLKKRQFDVVVAMSGVEAVEKAHTEHPDLILMDIELPDMDGWEASRRLKADPATEQIPIIAVTAHAMSDHEQKSREAGCDDYESKPIDFERLVSKINLLLERRQGK
ncbi:MAG TPA: response regulator [Gemmataceae bacterium]|nr:response regulator [Gemmataceae bacterium]